MSMFGINDQTIEATGFRGQPNARKRVAFILDESHTRVAIPPDAKIESLMITVNGLMLQHNFDYHINLQTKNIEFQGTMPKGEKGEITYYPYTQRLIHDLLLLPRKAGNIEFTDEQLQEFLEESKGLQFSLEKIRQKQPDRFYNPVFNDDLMGIPARLWVDEEGLKADLTLIEEE